MFSRLKLTKNEKKNFLLLKHLRLTELWKQETKAAERSWKNEKMENIIQGPFCSVGHHR